MRPQRAVTTWARSAVGAVVGAALGGILGSRWYARFGSEAEPVGALAAVLAGVVAGAVAIGAWWWSLPSWRAAPPVWRASALLGWIACGTLLVVGIVYIGGWTNADGPDAEAVVGILGIPTSVVGVWGIARVLRRRV